MKKLNVTVIFVDALLGTCPNDRNIYSQFIGTKNANATAESIAEEAVAIPVDEDGVPVDEKGLTIFPRDIEGRPFIYDYQWKGFFKEKCKFLKRDPKSRSSKLVASNETIDGSVFIQDRRNIIILPEGAELTRCERPLRAKTAQGERIALSCSEEIPAGSVCEFTVICQFDQLVPYVKEWLEDGILHGTGQWRNSGKGRFMVKFNSIEECTLEEYRAAKRKQIFSDPTTEIVAEQLRKYGFTNEPTVDFSALEEAVDLDIAIKAEKKAKREAAKAAKEAAEATKAADEKPKRGKKAE